MKGIIMTLLERMVLEEAGLELWQSMLDETGLPGVYTAGGLYDDEELFALVNSLSNKTAVARELVLCKFGRYTMTIFRELYPMFFDEGMGFFDFLLSVDSVIHLEVKKLYPDAQLPSFSFEHVKGGKQLKVRYESNRQLCDLAIGLMEESADVFNVVCTITHGPHCLKNGDDHCDLSVLSNG